MEEGILRKKIVAVIGNKKIQPDGIRYRLAYETGQNSRR